MFPPESPQSPLDGPQIPENEQIPQMTIPSSIQLRKSSDTLKNNMDMRDDNSRKRTSLKIENSNSSSPEITINLNGNNNNIINNNNNMNNNHVNDNETILDETNIDDETMKEIIENNNKRHRISMTSSSNEDDYNDNDVDDDDDDDEGDYNDLENGNTTDASRQRDSLISSEDLDIQAMNTLNNRLSGGDILARDGLLSPNEGPLARRYAEIAHFKNKWSDSSHHLRSRHGQIGSLDAEDSVGILDDDLQALLPATHGISRDDLSQSRASLVSSSDGGILAEGETSSESSGGSNSPPCDLGLVERLLRTHPVWFLPGIQRAGAVHLLQGKEEGNFIVRGSSQPNTMAVSVRLPPNTGPYIEHYLIQSNDGLLSLESSRFKFDSIPALIAHYAQCCDELPVQLTLPRALREAKNRQQLSSLALLGQEFWRYPMATPKPKSSVSPTSSVKTSNHTNLETIVVQQEQITTTVGTVFSSTTSQNIGTVMSGNAAAPHTIIPQSQSHHQITPLQNFQSGIVSQAETPSDTTSSLSSFTSTNQQLLSPESIDSVVLTMSPVESCRTGIIGKTSTFKAHTKKNQTNFEMINNKIVSPPNILHMDGSVRAPRPTPPNTLNLGPLRTPPAPPPRWSKPPTPISPSSESICQNSNNFTVTTTVTFSVEGNQNPQIVEVTSPNGNNTFQTISKRLSPEGECKQNMDTLSSQSSKRWQHTSSKDSSNRKILSPTTAETPTNRLRRPKTRKESKHYQESDILESPSVYCRSALGDKFSDYEDIWSQDNVNNSTLTRGGSNMSSFRPEGALGKRPDLLPDNPTVTSLNGNLLSPAGSTGSSNQSPPNQSKHTTPSVMSPQEPVNEFTKFHNNQNLVNSQVHASIVQQTLRFIDDEDSGNRNNNNINNNNLINSNIINNNHNNNNNNNKMDVEQSEDINRNVKLQTFSNPPSQMLQPRNRLGLILPNTQQQQQQQQDTTSGQEENISTPVQTPVNSRTKQGSPFYAEPADALNNITRRGQPLRQLPLNQRFSEPPKGPMRVPPIIALSPTDSEKLRNAGSLDELKKKHRKARGKFDPWPVDSSWEFMGNEDDNDYDTDANWKTNNQKVIENEKSKNKINEIKTVLSERPLTIHDVINKRLPDLKLPELKRSSSPILDNRNSDGGGTITRRQRISAYDNVEKFNSGYAQTALLNYMGSSHSDDGTVFSEPWDSSQWDSFLPQDDTSDTIHLSKCGRPAICFSEDDTIIDDLETGFKTTSTPSQPQKCATILRNNRSIRDREILCHPRNKSIQGGPGDSIGAYTLSLAADQNSTFSRNIENFISCTKESREIAPQVVMRNMRQFMSGMKNYLVKHGEGDFQREVQRASSRLKSDEFLNLDTILENVMHRLVVLPLREHLYGLFVDYYKRSGDIQLLVDNINYACQRSAADFGIRPAVIPPSVNTLQHISNILIRLQEAELPLEKLDFLLAAVAAIFESTNSSKGQHLGADDFLPLLVLVVAKTGFYSAEIEAEFMWNLLQPSLLSGEAGYYLTALCSAVHVLKSFMSSEMEGTGSLDWRSSSLPASSSVLRVIIPDEYNGSLQTRTLPVRPHTTTKDVCRTIAHKARITNPQDYGLFKLVDGEETLLMDNECPQDVRIAARGKHCILAYKRIDAKIAWPTLTAF